VNQNKKIYIIAGEASGDVHGGNLVKALLKINSNLTIRGWGGDEMQKAGADLVQHYKQTAFMGFWEVVKNLPTIFSLIKLAKKDISNFKPDVLILIDYAGFNLRMAKYAKNLGIKTVYYISPKVWAWKSGRVNKIKAYVDKMLVIFPFEKQFYKKHNYEVEYVGNPLLDEIAKHQQINKTASYPKKHLIKTSYPKKYIALLPGSRKQEVNKMLPILVATARRFKNEEFVIAGLSTLGKNLYKQHLNHLPNVQLWMDKTQQLYQQSKAAIVTSGTATLEAALYNVPQMVVYKSSRLSYEIGKRVVKVKYISLVNLIMDKPVVLELIQHNCTIEKISRELYLMLENGAYRNKIFNHYHLLQQKLGKVGASTKAASIILTEVL